MEQKALGRSKEDYLKAILVVTKGHGMCRSIDVSNHLGVSKASVCIAIKKLEQSGLVVREDVRIILTDAGRELAEKMYEKSAFLSGWFKEIGVSDKTAEEDACLIEHVISAETYKKMQAYVKMS